MRRWQPRALIYNTWYMYDLEGAEQMRRTSQDHGDNNFNVAFLLGLAFSCY